MHAAVRTLLAAGLLALGAVQVAAVPGGVCTPLPSQPGYPDEFLLTSQADLDNLRADCTTINGSVNIACTTSSDIVASDLEVFYLVTEITGFLRIQSCPLVTSLNGFRSLQRIRGQQLYTAVTGEGGFALYILNNPLLTTLEGLQSLTEIRGNDVLGQGRVRLIDNDNLCYAERVDWSQLLGDNWWRALSPLSNGASVNCAAKSCNADCSCSSTCFSDTLAGCQGDCTEDDKWDTYIIILIIVFAVVVAVTVVLYFCCSSDRLGCKMRCCDSTCTAGALADKPGTKALDSVELLGYSNNAGSNVNMRRRGNAGASGPKNATKNKRKVSDVWAGTGLVGSQGEVRVAPNEFLHQDSSSLLPTNQRTSTMPSGSGLPAIRNGATLPPSSLPSHSAGRRDMY